MKKKNKTQPEKMLPLQPSERPPGLRRQAGAPFKGTRRVRPHTPDTFITHLSTEPKHSGHGDPWSWLGPAMDADITRIAKMINARKRKQVLALLPPAKPWSSRKASAFKAAFSVYRIPMQVLE